MENYLDQRRKALTRLMIQLLGALFVALLSAMIGYLIGQNNIMLFYKFVIWIAVLLLFLCIILALQITTYDRLVIKWKIISPFRCKFFNFNIVKFDGLHWLISYYKNEPLTNPIPLCPKDNSKLIACDPDNKDVFCNKCEYRQDGESLKKSFKKINDAIHEGDKINMEPIIEDISNYKGF